MSRNVAWGWLRNRRQVGPTGVAEDRDDGGDRFVDELLVDRVEVVEALHRLAVADRELPRLRPLADVLELGHLDRHLRLLISRICQLQC
jgi:hypothetical protein